MCALREKKFVLSGGRDVCGARGGHQEDMQRTGPTGGSGKRKACSLALGSGRMQLGVGRPGSEL